MSFYREVKISSRRRVRAFTNVKGQPGLCIECGLVHKLTYRDPYSGLPKCWVCLKGGK